MPLQVSPVEAVLAFRTNLSVPAWLGTWRSTENEPLGACVVDVPLATTVPLSVIFQFQTWPTWLVSISASTSIRPSSVLALSFQLEPCEHWPLVLDAVAAAVRGLSRHGHGESETCGDGECACDAGE